ncbi:unannotated protein [freshwater metagenome]|uniref:Unannotated protein n=1 Tax=freshwater metagenome TaxID=449393 RepID=A0A6J7QW13_9ZZZZ
MGDLDPGLLGLLDVAPPELVERGEQIVLSASDERDLEDIARLHIAEAGPGVGLLGPAEGAQPVGHRECVRPGLVGCHLAKAMRRALGDRGLEGVGIPSADRDHRPQLHREGADRFQMLGKGLEPCGQVETGALARPVDIGAFGQVGQEPLDLRHLPQQHQSGADKSVGFVEPAERCVGPFGFRSSPARQLQEGDRGLARSRSDVGQMLVRRDAADGERRGGRHRDEPTAAGRTRPWARHQRVTSTTTGAWSLGGVVPLAPGLRASRST